jgi:hypothetical protein
VYWLARRCIVFRDYSDSCWCCFSQIKLKVKKEKGDHERDANRRDLLQFLNLTFGWCWPLLTYLCCSPAMFSFCSMLFFNYDIHSLFGSMHGPASYVICLMVNMWISE